MSRCNTLLETFQMLGFGNSPQEALVVSSFVLLVGAIALSALVRWRGSPVAADLLMPAAFIASYWLVYNKVPTFPPVGAVNKVFYLAVFGALAGAAAGIAGRSSIHRTLVLAQPIAAALWIGQPRLAVAWWEVASAGAAGVAIMALLLREGDQPYPEGVRKGSVVAVAALGFAPIALLGASSSTFQLCLLFAAASAGILVVHLVRPAFRFGPASFCGALGGLIAAADTVVLITRKSDLLAFAILGLSFALPALAADRTCQAFGVSAQFPRLVVHVALAAVPAAAAVLVAFVNYGSSFPV